LGYARRRPGTSLGDRGSIPLTSTILMHAPSRVACVDMDIFPSGGTSYERGDLERFTGTVDVRRGPAIGDGTDIVEVHFAAGARTHWHSHPGGQILYVVSGRGRVRSRGGEGVQALPGDILLIPAGEEHFHGGAPDAPMVHVAVNGRGAPDWGEAVTDADYDAGF
jgi:quercetin dioxygenase-like cupin family protein